MQQSGSGMMGGGDDDEPHQKPPADGATGTSKKQKKVTLTKKGQVRKKKAKKPKDMPRRPLSAYNLFFREQRARIIEEREQSDAAVEESDLFSSMGKTIAKRWRELTPDQMVKYQSLAEIEMKRYRQEMEAYHLAVAKRNRQNQMSVSAVQQDEDQEDARLPASNQNFAAAPSRMMQESMEEGKSNSLPSDLLMSQIPEYRQQQHYQQDASTALMAGLNLGSSQGYFHQQLGADASMQGLSGFSGLGFPTSLSARQYLQQLNSMTDNSLLQNPRASLDDSIRSSLQMSANLNIGNPTSLDSQLIAALSRNNNDYSSAFRNQMLDVQLTNALHEQSRQATLGRGGSLELVSGTDQQSNYPSSLAARMPQQGQGAVSSPLIQLLRHQQEEQRQMQLNAQSSGAAPGAGFGYGSYFSGQGNNM